MRSVGLDAPVAVGKQAHRHRRRGNWPVRKRAVRRQSPRRRRAGSCTVGACRRAATGAARRASRAQKACSESVSPTGWKCAGRVSAGSRPGRADRHCGRRHGCDRRVHARRAGCWPACGRRAWHGGCARWPVWWAALALASRLARGLSLAGRGSRCSTTSRSSYQATPQPSRALWPGVLRSASAASEKLRRVACRLEMASSSHMAVPGLWRRSGRDGLGPLYTWGYTGATPSRCSHDSDQDRIRLARHLRLPQLRHPRHGAVRRPERAGFRHDPRADRRPRIPPRARRCTPKAIAGPGDLHAAHAA